MLTKIHFLVWHSNEINRKMLNKKWFSNKTGLWNKWMDISVYKFGQIATLQRALETPGTFFTESNNIVRLRIQTYATLSYSWTGYSRGLTALASQWYFSLNFQIRFLSWIDELINVSVNNGVFFIYLLNVGSCHHAIGFSHVSMK